jgi:hypothetical protein
MLPAFIFFIGLKKERNTIGNEGPIKLFCSYIFETDSNKQFCLLLRSKCLVPIAIGSKHTDSIFFFIFFIGLKKEGTLPTAYHFASDRRLYNKSWP